MFGFGLQLRASCCFCLGYSASAPHWVPLRVPPEVTNVLVASRQADVSAAECADTLTLLLLVAKMRAHPSVSVLHPGTETQDSHQPNSTNASSCRLYNLCVCVCVCVCVCSISSSCVLTCVKEQINRKIIRREAQSMEMCLIKAVCVDSMWHVAPAAPPRATSSIQGHQPIIWMFYTRCTQHTRSRLSVIFHFHS